jgi:uncharacterized protein (TIGR03083 family)
MGDMPTSLTLDRHLEAIRRSGPALADRAELAGLDAPVPTCPDWTIAHLVAHLAMAHRWAAAHVRRDVDREPLDDDVIRTTQPDLVGYYREEYDGLVRALEAAPADLDAWVFLNDAPAPREFWARRQAHETTIHAVDALAGRLGAIPTAAECAIDLELAIDGIDELLRGFITRRPSRLYAGKEFTILVRPTDHDRAWLVSVSAEPPVTSELHPGTEGAEVAAVFFGTAAQLYVGLWNRGDEITVEGDQGMLDRWRSAHHIRWG